MSIQLDFGSRIPVFEQIVRNIIQQCAFGILQPGDSLPSIRSLAVELGINPNTVQKAFRLMEEEGFIRTNGNAGSVIFVDDAILHRIDEELTRGMVEQFVQDAKDNGLSFPRVISLIGELWEKD